MCLNAGRYFASSASILCTSMQKSDPISTHHHQFGGRHLQYRQGFLNTTANILHFWYNRQSSFVLKLDYIQMQLVSLTWLRGIVVGAIWHLKAGSQVHLGKLLKRSVAFAQMISPHG